MSLAHMLWARGSLAAAAMVAAALLAAASLAQSPAGGYRIAGRVVNAVTGEPVPRATVSVQAEEDNHLMATAVSDAEGNFAVSGLAAGKYPLTASRRGFRTAYYDAPEEFNTAIVTGPGQDTAHLVCQLAPGAVIYGTVTGDGGDPAENANVLLFRRDPAAPGRRPAQLEGVMTDDTGAYEFSGLAEGEYYVAVKAEVWYAVRSVPGAAADNSLDVAYPVTFFDSTADEASATPLVLEAGTRQQADIVLHAVPALHLKMSSPNLKPNEGIGIELRQSVFGLEYPLPFETLTVGNEAWIDGLAPGQYELSSTNPPRTMEVDVSSSTESDPESGTPSQPVGGTVRMADGSAPGELNLVLSPLEGGRNRLEAVARQGQFHFDAVPPGEWTLEAYRAGNSFQSLFVISLSVSGSASEASQFTVRDRPLTVAATLSSVQTRVDGFARSGAKGTAGAMVMLVPVPAPRDPAVYRALLRRDQSDSDGSFSLRDVAPGHYLVIAVSGGWKLDWRDRGVIARYLSSGVAVTIGAQAGGAVRLAQPVEAVSP